MSDALYELLMKLPRKNLIGCMAQAIDEMEQWNGRSRTHCICTALGCKENMKEDGSSTWTVPSLKDIKKNTDSFY